MDATELEAMAFALDQAARQGDIEDRPEGARYITVSDTLARQWARQLRRYGAVPVGDWMERQALRIQLEIAELRTTLNDPGSYDLPPGAIRSWRRGIWQ